MKIFIISLLLSLHFQAFFAQTAHQFFEKKEYTASIHQYEKEAKKSPSDAAFYNLGNAYYRQKNYPKAILNYKRALLYSPTDTSIQHNLSLAQFQIQQSENQPSELFFTALLRNFANFFSINQWSVLALISMLLSSIAYSFFRKIKQQHSQKIIFAAGCIFALLTLTSLSCAIGRYIRFHNNHEAVVMIESTLMDAPNQSGKGVINIPAGNAAIAGQTYGSWIEITFHEKKGWLPTSAIEFVNPQRHIK